MSYTFSGIDRVEVMVGPKMALKHMVTVCTQLIIYIDIVSCFALISVISTCVISIRVLKL